MKRLVVMTCVIACARGAAAQPAADEPIMKCHAMPPDTKIVVTFKPEIPIRDLTAWMLGFSCKTVIFGAGVKLSANVTVVAPSELTPKQAMQVYVDAVQASGYVVIQKPDTIIIKLDPKAPHECPDIADQVPT
ncbi:MAG TPA: hypothetical protein VLX92_33355, partial [Kofleriaceae bacterium]|nr:hypothetical protein [Kofleriaceae bacterium]